MVPRIADVAFILSVAACGPEGVALERWQGEHVVYESSPSLQVCGGTHAWVDNFVPFILEELGLESAPAVHYQWLERQMLVCRDGIRGCARGTDAMSAEPFLLHELVHAALSDYPNQPFFSEGIAVALDPLQGYGIGPTYLLAPVGQGLADPRPWMTLTTQELQSPGYYVAGSFVSFLLARHGPAKFLAFIRRLDGSRELDVIGQAFADIYKRDLDAESELFTVVDGPCTDEQFHPPLYDCTAREIPWDGERWYLEDVMDCASDNVIGGLGTDPPFGFYGLRVVTFNVPTTGTYHLRAESDGDVQMQIGPCLACPWRRDDQGHGFTAPETRTLELAAGPHFMRVLAKSDSDASFTVELNQTGFDEP